MTAVDHFVALLGGWWWAAPSAAALALLMVLSPALRSAVFRLAPPLLAALVCVAWYEAIHASAARQPAAKSLEQISVAKTAGELAVGGAALLQDPSLAGSASEPHVGFRQAVPGDWRISNVSATRRLSLRYRETEGGAAKLVSFDASRFLLESGDALVLAGGNANAGANAVLARFDSVSDRDVVISDFGPPPGSGEERTAPTTLKLARTAAGQRITRSGVELPDCAESGVVEEFLRRAARLLPREDDELRVARLGAPRDCRTKSGPALAVGGLPFAAAELVYIRDLGFALVRSGLEPLAIERQGRRLPLTAIEHPMRFERPQGPRFELESFIAGYTRYRLDWPAETGGNLAFNIVPDENPQRVIGLEGDCIAGQEAFDIGQFGIRVRPRCSESPPALVDAAGGAAAKEHHKGAWQLAPLPSRAAFQIAILAAVGFAVLAGATRWLYSRFGGASGLLRQSPRLAETVERGLRLAAASLGVGCMVLAYVFYVRLPPPELPEAQARMAALQPQAPWIAMLAWAGAIPAVFLARGARFFDNWVFLVWTALAATGHLSLTALSLAMEETRFLRFANDASFGVMASAGAVIAVSQIPPSFFAGLLGWLSVNPTGRGGGADISDPILEDGSTTAGRADPSGRPLSLMARIGRAPGGVARRGSSGIGRFLAPLAAVPLGFWVLAGVIILSCLAWFLFGTETGIAGFLQPSEAVKTLMVLALAAMLVLALDRSRSFVAAGSAHRPSTMTTRYVVIGVVLSGLLGVALDQFAGLGLLGYPPAAGFFVLWLAFRNAFWKAFVVIALVIGFMLIAPVTRSDLSPALTLVTTMVLSMSTVVLMQGIALLSDWALVWSGRRRRPVPGTFRPPANRGSRAAARFLRRQWKRGFPVLLYPWPWLVALPLAIGFLGVWAQRDMLQDAVESRAFLMKQIGKGMDVPVKRVISWVEFNAAPPAGRSKLAIEFADTALQVDLSRRAIAAARCDRWPQVFADVSGAWSREAVGLAVSLGRRAELFLLGGRCVAAGPEEQAIAIAKRIPAVQSDFVGAWLVAYLGRDGAAAVAALQLLCAITMMTSGFLVMRWTPGQSLIRPAAAAGAFGCIGFAIMMAQQWLISWANALGVVPVMGQPSTFLSHGRSHYVLFGLPAMLFVLSALRMRAAYEGHRFLRRGVLDPDVPPVPIGKALATFWRRIWWGAR